MTKCTCGHEKKEHMAFPCGCTKCLCSEFSETIVSPPFVLTIGVVVKNTEDKDKEDKSD